MKTTRAAICLALALAPSAVLAAGKTKTVEHTKIMGDAAIASWEYTQGNILTFVNLVVSNENVKDATGKYERPLLSLAIAQSAIDSGAVLIAGSATSDDFTLNVDNKLNAASLHLANAVFEDDSSGTVFNISADLTWAASGPTSSQNTNDKFSYPGLKINVKFKGDFRDAIATGTITGKGIEFAPLPSTSGQLQQNKFGSLIITTQPK